MIVCKGSPTCAGLTHRPARKSKTKNTTPAMERARNTDPAMDSRFDVNGDGVINVGDLLVVVRMTHCRRA